LEVFEFSSEHKAPVPDYGSKGVFAGKIIEGWGKLRRFYLSHFRKEYVRRMKKLRKGACRYCGSCCAVMIKCPHLVGNLCKIYERRYEQCAHFPIDARDLIFRENTCGYYFEKK